MSYAKTKKEVSNLVTCEASSMKAEGFTFRSKYEAESVIRIQLEEARRELHRCNGWSEAFTEAVGMQRDVGLQNYAEELNRQAEYLAVEAIRLAALAKSYTDTKRGGEA